MKYCSLVNAESSAKEVADSHDHLVRWTKGLGFLAAITMTTELLVIRSVAPASGYELTIYDSLPWFCWLLVSISFALGLLIIVIHAFSRAKSQWYLVGLVVVIISDIIFLGLPHFRGYAEYPSGDALTHLGMIRDIELTGEIGSENMYPIVHILGIGFREIAVLGYPSISILLYTTFNMFYLAGALLLARIITRDEKLSILMIALASPLIFSFLHTLIHPSVFSIFILPTLLYLYHKRVGLASNKVIVALMLIPFALLMTFSHPVTALFSIVVILTLNLARRAFARDNQTGFPNAPKERRNRAGINNVVPAIMITCFFSWYLYFGSARIGLKNAVDFIVHGGGTSLYDYSTQALYTSGLSFNQSVLLFTYRYGDAVLYFALSLLGIVIATRAFLAKKERQHSNLSVFSILFLVASAASAFSLFGFTGEYDATRVSRFFLAIAPFLIGFTVGELANISSKSERNARQLAIAAIVAILVISTSTLSTYTIYGSPRTIQPNLMTTEKDIVGVEWFALHQDRDILTSTLGLGLNRIESFLFGDSVGQKFSSKLDPRAIPSHFGYPDNSSLSITFNFEDRYLITGELARVAVYVLPSNIANKALHYSVTDFETLSEDKAVARIYSNGEVDVWRVMGA